ncbi:AraC family transcriptional regulator [Paenibacillus sp. IB182496]|uniref:AraC family transcriptional regulator n=1 Tax=Paenibacillus sabuli TaxID=2772509 RepID=A0A927C031_9BACL|nr:AraC family transcriptional regulator [Paenibacillus sabuli]MBD2848438.1 AraC family transcriptional regulator [Paenibacillus sabuli]
MKWLRILNHRKYLQRMFFYVNLSMAGLLIITALSIYFYSQQTILQTQKEANQKVLLQIKHNLTYINDIVRNIGLMASIDPGVIYLMNAVEPEPVMKFQTLRKLDMMTDSTTFIDSILILNGTTRSYYSGGSGMWTRQHWEGLQARLTGLLEAGDSEAVARLVPLKLEEAGPNVDLFSFILTENYPESGTLPNSIIVNIRPQWIFENISGLDNLSDGDSGMILVDQHGQMLQSGADATEAELETRRQVVSAVHAGSDRDEAFSVQRVDGRAYVISEMNVGVSQWKVMNILPYTQVLGRAETLRNITLALTVVFLAASLLLSAFVTNRLYRPVGKLLELFRGDGTGPVEAAPYGSRDEMSYISHAVRTTLARLREADRDEGRNRQIMSDYYLRRWVTDSRSMTDEELDHCAEASPELLGDLREQTWQLAVVGMDATSDGAGAANAVNASSATSAVGATRAVAPLAQEKLYRFAACNIMEETIARRYPNRVVDMNNGYIVVLIRVRPEKAELEVLHELLADALGTYKRYYGQRTFTAAVSDTVARCREVTALYEQTVQQFMYRVAFPPGAVITPADVRSNMARVDFTLPSELERRLAEGIRTRDEGAIRSALERVFEQVASLHYDYMPYAVMQLVLLVKQVLREPVFAPYVNAVELQRLNHHVIRAESLASMRELLEQVLLQLCRTEPSEPKEDRNTIIVDTIKEFIETNYADVNLSLQSIAAYLKMSSAYVGRIFKQYEQCSVGDYLNGYRLDRACELLADSSYNVKEIANYLGFSNASYFITLFKKRNGVTPKEYRMNATLGKP